MWATKVCNIIKEQDKGAKGLNSVSHKDAGMNRFSGTRENSNRRQSDPAVLMTTEGGSFNMPKDQLEKLTTTVENFIGQMTTWRSDMTTWKKMMDEDMKTVKLDMKNCLEMQKIPSNHA